MSKDDATPQVSSDRARDEVISVVREELRIQRHAMDRGGVRVRVSVEERDEVVEMLLHEQDVEIDRLPIGRVVQVPPQTRQEGDTLVLSIVEEVSVVERRLILKEEIHIRRRERQRAVQETVRLRSEVVELEAIPPAEN